MSMSNCELCGTLNESSIWEFDNKEGWRCRKCGFEYAIEKSKNKWDGIESQPEEPDDELPHKK